MTMKVYTIWKEQSGGFVLKQGDEPIHQGDTCFRRIECPGWDEAMAELHRFMDQQIQNVAV